MGDSEGKDFIRRLLEEILKALPEQYEPARLYVMPTGSASYPCFVSTKVQLDEVVSSSDESQRSEPPDRTDRTYKMKAPFSTDEMSTPRRTHRGETSSGTRTFAGRSGKLSESPESSDSSHSDSPPRIGFRLSDVVVYSKTSYFDPIRTHVDISIKKGQVKNVRNLFESMLGRLPYQDDLYGVLVNSHSAQIWHAQIWRATLRDGNDTIQMRLLANNGFAKLDQARNTVHIDETVFFRFIDNLAKLLISV